LDLDDTYSNTSSAFASYFDFDSKFVKRHARLGRVGQDRMGRLAKEGLLEQLTKCSVAHM